MRVLFDTSVWIEHLRRGALLDAHASRLRLQPQPAAPLPATWLDRPLPLETKSC
jgi:hypothetical protein